MLGSIYGEEEIAAAMPGIRASMDPTVGFGFTCPEIEGFEVELARELGTAHAVSINGAGSGLDMAMMCLDLQPGDEVICPSVNFRASPMAVIGQGGRWVPCEIDPHTLQADPADIERRITPRTRAIFPVHMNGGPAPMDDYEDLAQRHPHPVHGPLRVIADGARACGAWYRERPVASRGWMTVYSFHTQKNMTTLGEGGAVITDDPGVAARLRDIRQFGGAEGWGTNYKMTKVQAAVGSVQVSRLASFVASRRRLAARRDELLRGIDEIELPQVVPGGTHTYYLYTILVKPQWAGKQRDALMSVLRERFAVDTVVANPPCHSMIPFLRNHVGEVHLPVSEDLARRLLCLPMHPAMSNHDNEYICAAVWEAVEAVRDT